MVTDPVCGMTVEPDKPPPAMSIKARPGTFAARTACTNSVPMQSYIYTKQNPSLQQPIVPL